MLSISIIGEERPKGTGRRTIKTEIKETGYDWNNITRFRNVSTNGETLLQSFVQKCMKRIKQVIMGEILKVLGLCTCI